MVHMSKAIDSLVVQLVHEIERRLTLAATNRDLTNKLAQERQNCAKYEARIAELEAMPVAFVEAEAKLVSADWVGEGVDDEPEWEDAYEYEHPFEGDAYDGHLTFTRF